SLATVTPSFVTVGEPKDFSSTTFRPDGPSVTLTARASLETPRRIASRASWSNAILFAAMFVCSLNAIRLNHEVTKARKEKDEEFDLLRVFVSSCLRG